MASNTPEKEKEEKQSRGQGLHKQLRKTKYCMFHLQGVCTFGEACAFAHELEELQGVPDLKKTRLCRYKDCKEKNCLFAHSEAELRSTHLCFKKTLCMWHFKGRCRHGGHCRFAHGADELRTYRRLRAEAGIKAENDPPNAKASQSSSSSRTEELRSRPSSQSSRSPVAQPLVVKARPMSFGQQPGLQQVGVEPNQGLPMLLAELQRAGMSSSSQGEVVHGAQHPLQGRRTSLPPWLVHATLTALSQNLADLTQQLQTLQILAARQSLQLPHAPSQPQQPQQPQQQQLHVPATSLAPSLNVLPHLRSAPSESDALVEALNFLVQGPRQFQ